MLPWGDLVTSQVIPTVGRKDQDKRARVFEPPTALFVEVRVENQPDRNSKLDDPPSPFRPLRTAEPR
jgi:hypothetical protein